MFVEYFPSNLTELLKNTASLPDFPPDYSPDVIEIFDQHGLLAGMVSGQAAYECQRETTQVSDYLAWYFDGQLALLCVGSQILFNRMKLMVLGASILRNLEVEKDG
ncbi:MAG: hypothetical protein WA919_02120 [Coleofasciculaceae cyanobacterium]